MSEPPFACVIDANVVLKLYFEQTGSDKASALFAILDSQPQPRFFVPDLFYAECTNAFSNYARVRDYTPKEARADMTTLRALALHVVPTADLAQAALEIAIKHRITGYDAFYVALAERVKSPLITADEKLVRSLAGKEYSVYSLAAFTLPPA